MNDDLLKLVLYLLRFKNALPRSYMLYLFEQGLMDKVVTKEDLRDFVLEMNSAYESHFAPSLRESTTLQGKLKNLSDVLPVFYKEAEAIRQAMAKEKINVLILEDEAYPDLLKEAVDAPLILFYQGDISLLDSYSYYLSVVGSRNMTSYGRRFILGELKALTSYPVCLVSGLARGCDTMAHQMALDNQGFTIACLAHGLDSCYPKEHLPIKKRIEKEGLVISELGPGVKARPSFFPARNRIISGLSQATLIVEAKASSGSLITAEFAAQQGREVMAVPGSIYQENSRGCNRLIQDGAFPVTNYQDILDILGLGPEDLLRSIEQSNASDNSSDPVIAALKEGDLSEEALANELKTSVIDMRIRLLPYEAKGLVGRYKGKVFLTKA